MSKTSLHKSIHNYLKLKLTVITDNIICSYSPKINTFHYEEYYTYETV